MCTAHVRIQTGNTAPSCGVLALKFSIHIFFHDRQDDIYLFLIQSHLFICLQRQSLHLDKPGVGAKMFVFVFLRTCVSRVLRN